MTFQELYDFIKSKPDQAIDCKYFHCPSIHFTADKQLEKVNFVIELGRNPKNDRQCKESKKLIEIIVEELKKMNYER